MGTIYGYWEGEHRHWFYDLCWETVTAHNPTAVLLGPDDVHDIIGDLPAPVRSAYVTHRCDWIRKKVIARLGGAWLDMDYICWSDLSFLPAMGSAFDYVGYKEWGGGWMDNFFAGRKDSIVLETAAEHALSALDRPHGEVGWLSASTESLNHAFEQHRWCLFNQIPTHVVTPVSCMEGKFFTRERRDEKVDGYQALGCMASFHCLRKYLSTRSRADVITGSTGLSAALRRALGISRARPKRRRSRPDERRIEPEWTRVSPTHVPAAFHSENVGDDIQSLAAMDLWGVTRVVDRDDPSSWPEDAVVPLIGWWGRAKFPTTATVKLIGFHCAREGVDQVMENATWFRHAVELQGFPAYCRDLFTRDLLRRLDIPAEFGGCVTLTLRRPWTPGSERLAIDAPSVPDGYRSMTNVDHRLRRLAPEQRLERAARRLDEVCAARQIVTSRLHIWLPALAIGVPVTLQHQTMGSRERLGGYDLDAVRRSELFPAGESVRGPRSGGSVDTAP